MCLPCRTRMRCSSISSIYGSRMAECQANTRNSVRDICDIGKNRGVRKNRTAMTFGPIISIYAGSANRTKAKVRIICLLKRLQTEFLYFCNWMVFLPVSCAALCPVPSLSAMPSSLTAIPFRYSQPRKRKRENRAKEKGELPRPGCFHKGIILIVNS